MENMDKVYSILSTQKGIENIGYTTINTFNLSRLTNLEIIDVKKAINELVKSGRIFYNKIYKTTLDLASGTIKTIPKARIYINKDIYIRDKEYLQRKEKEKKQKDFEKEAIRLENIKKLSSESLVLLSFINIEKKDKAFIELSNKEIENFTGLNEKELEIALKELLENKQIFILKIDYEEKELEKQTKKLIFTSLELAALALNEML